MWAELSQLDLGLLVCSAYQELAISRCSDHREAGMRPSGWVCSSKVLVFTLGLVACTAFLPPRPLQPDLEPLFILYVGRLSRAEVAPRPQAASRRSSPFSLSIAPKTGDGPERPLPPSARLTKRSRQQRHQQLQVELSELDKAGAQASLDMYEMALRSCAKVGESGTALKLLRAMEGILEPQGKKPSRLAYNLVLEAAANSNRHDQAMKLYREMVRDERVGVNVFTYGPLLTLCAKRGDGASALKLLDEMEKRGVQPNALTYTTTIDACERNGLREETVRLLREMKDKGVRPTVVTYNTIIARRAEHPDTWTEALDWLERLLVSGVEPDRLSFAAAINACERAQEWALVVELTEKAELLADVTMLTRQINALLKLERYQDALDVMQQVKERELRPDEVLYTLVLKACALHGSTKEALHYLADMRQAGLTPNVVTFSTAMDACKAAGQWEVALDLLGEMKATGVQANEVTYSILFDILAAAGQWQRALHLFMTLDREGVKKNVWLYTAAIRACAKGQQLETALGLLREVTSSPTLAPSDDYEMLCLYTAALDACEKSGNGAEALRLLRQMKAEAGVEPDEVAYGAAISACRKAGLAADSLRLLSFMVNQRMNPNLSVYNTVLGALCSTPQYLGKAVEILKFMRQSGGQGRVPKPNAQSFSQVVDALADDLQWKEAIEMYESMRKEGHRPEVLTCAKVIRACEKNQCWREALQLLDNMRKDDYQIYELQLLDQVFKKVLQVVAAGFGKAPPVAAEGPGQGMGERRLDRALRTQEDEVSTSRQKQPTRAEPRE